MEERKFAKSNPGGGGYYKGFTLIELLAIIVILAIIAVITVPIILNIIEDASKNASIDSAYGYKNALEKYYMKKVVQNSEYELPNGYKTVSELPEDFVISGEIPTQDGWVKLNKGVVEEYSLKYGDYVVTMNKNKNISFEKSNKVIPFLPDEYKEVEYLESTGTQYIQTTQNVLEKDYIETEFFMPFVANQLDKYMVSTQPWNNPGGSRFSMGVHTNGGLTSLFCSGFGSKTTSNTLLIPNTVNDSEFHKWIYNNKIFKIEDLNLTFDGSNIAYVQNPQNSIYLFYGYDSPTTGKLKKYIQKRNDNPILYLVPVIRKSDNKPGMLDLANRTNNLFSSEWERGSIELSNGQNADAGYSIRTKDYISVTPNKHYAISRNITTDYMNVRGYDKDKNYIGSGVTVIDLIAGSTNANPMAAQNDNCIISPKENIYYLRFNDLSNNLRTKYMMVEGDTQAEYEPYGYKFFTNAGEGEFIPGPEI